MSTDRSGRYRRPGNPAASSSRINSAQIRRLNTERSQKMRRVDAVAPPDAHANRARARAALLVFALVYLCVIARGAWLAVGPDQRLSDRLAGQQERVIAVAPQRGSIVDRMGRPLAISIELGSIFVDPGLVEDAVRAAELLAPLVERSPADVLARMTREGSRFVWLRRQAPPHVSEAVKDLDIPGVRVVAEARRSYPSGSLASQVLGFTGVEGQGLEGLEARLNDELMGDTVEYRVLRDGHRRATNHAAVLSRRSTEGNTVVLTLDHSIQHRAEESLAAAISRHEAAGGWLVTLDVQTGAVLAMVSQPGYDPNNFRGVDPDHFRNRAVSEVYEPGSVMKPFVIAEVLQQGLARADEQLFCEKGAYRIGRRTIHDSHPHEELTVAEILKYSSNIGTAKLAERLGPAGLEAMYRRYGFGAKTGLDVYGEELGILRPHRRWSRIDLATQSFGQGIAVTGVQLATAFAMLVNGGTRITPHLLQEVRDIRGKIVRRWQAPAEVTNGVPERLLDAGRSAQIRRLLAAVMEEGGTGTRARLDEYSSGGKTGTAQKVKDGRYAKGYYVSSFIGFAPVAQPRIVTLVTLDEPTNKYYGGTVAGPVFKEVTTHALRVLGVPTDLHREQGPFAEPTSRDGETEPGSPTDGLLAELIAVGEGWELPDLKGYSARDAVRLLASAGLQIEMRGSGLVSSQIPLAGATVAPGAQVQLALIDGLAPARRAAQ